jgi:HK97 family phage major capsid protein/HK97 family phage prohead protease
MNRAYSLITVKSVDEDKRILSGIATTPTADRMGDIVEPKGAEFSLPIPFLWQHDFRQPIGHVQKAKVTKDGIEVEIKIARSDEPGTLKDRLDEAWQSIRAGLVRGLSIGFKALKFSRLDDGGLRFIKWSWLELSAVTIAVNHEATITAIKSADAPFFASGGGGGGGSCEKIYVVGSGGGELFLSHKTALAASGRERSGVVRLTPPGASGFSKSKSPKEGTEVKTYQEQIAEWEAKRAAKVAEQTAIMTKSADEGRTLDAAEKEAHDTLRGEIKEIDEHLPRLAEMAKNAQTLARPVNGADPEAASLSRESAAPRIQVLEPKLEKGTAFLRYVLCRAEAKAMGGGLDVALNVAKMRYPEYAPLHRILKSVGSYGDFDIGRMRKAQELVDFTKTAVAGGTTSDANWATELVNYTILASQFIEYLRPQTIVGKFGIGGVPNLNRVPFNVKVPRQTTKGSGYWTGEAKPKYLTKFNIDMVTLDFHKIATIAAITKELARFSNPQAETLVRNELTRAVVERADIDFIDPNKAASAGVSPASILNDATALVSATTTGTVAEVITDIQSMLSEFIQLNIPVSSMVWIMNQNVALALSLMQTSLGQTAFQGISMNGGTFQGIPVITSQYVPAQLLILVSAADIMLADDGNVSIAVSEDASLEMLDSGSSQDGTTGTGVSLVSMFQTNMLAIRAEREITWLKSRTGAAQYMTGFNPGGTAGSGDI